MITLTETAVEIGPDLFSLRDEFKARGVVKLKGLLSPKVLKTVAGRLAATEWAPREHTGIGRELVPVNRAAVVALNFLANTPSFMEAIVKLTECQPVTHFIGRVYRMLPDSDHYDDWHSDNIEKRRVGMSINLSEVPYKGGTFCFREQHTLRPLGEIPNLTLGDAILFSISGSLEHMVTPIVGDQPKTAFAGWFVSEGKGIFSDLKG